MEQNEKLKRLTTEDTKLKRELGLFPSISIIAGIMIGSGIFFIGSFVLSRANMAPGLALLAWLLAGVVSVLTGLCFAELGASMPRSGGAYVYLREAYGPLWGFLSGWVSFLVTCSGSISALAVGFATYLGALTELSDMAIKLIAIAVIIVLTAINIFGVKLGGRLQSVFLIAKLVPIVLILVVGLFAGQINPSLTLDPSGTASFSKVISMMGFALIASLWAFEGWSNICGVAEEVKNPRRNIPLALIIAIGGVTLLYILFNFALFRVLPLEVIATEARPASLAAKNLFGPIGGTLVTVGALISIFGSTNGCVIAFPRIYYAMAEDGLFFKSFKEIHPVYKTPVISLVASAVVAILLVFSGTFEQLATMVTFSSWVFYLMTIVALFVLRRKYPTMERPYRVPFYPVLPIIATLAGGFLLVNCLLEDTRSSLIGLIVPLIGVPVYYFFKKRNEKAQQNS